MQIANNVRFTEPVIINIGYVEFTLAQDNATLYNSRDIRSKLDFNFNNIEDNYPDITFQFTEKLRGHYPNYKVSINAEVKSTEGLKRFLYEYDKINPVILLFKHASDVTNKSEYGEMLLQQEEVYKSNHRVDEIYNEYFPHKEIDAREGAYIEEQAIREYMLKEYAIVIESIISIDNRAFCY